MTTPRNTDTEIHALSGSEELERCLEIFDRANDGIDEESVRPELQHLSAMDPDRFVIAFKGGNQIGFASAYVRDQFWFLSYLYVLPEAQAAGVGRMLLERVLPSELQRSSMTLATTIEADKSASAMLYATLGIVPRLPYYFLSELPSIDALAGLPEGVRSEPLILADHGALLDDMDEAQLGFRRLDQHAMWAERATNARVYLASGGRLLGYGYEAPDDWLAPICAVDQDVALGVVSDMLSAYSGEDLQNVMFPVAGNADVLLAGLLGAGMRALDGGAQLVYCSNGRLPPPAYLLGSGTMP